MRRNNRHGDKCKTTVIFLLRLKTRLQMAGSLLHLRARARLTRKSPSRFAAFIRQATLPRRLHSLRRFAKRVFQLRTKRSLVELKRPVIRADLKYGKARRGFSSMAR